MHSARTNSRGGDGAGLRAARSVVAVALLTLGGWVSPCPASAQPGVDTSCSSCSGCTAKPNCDQQTTYTGSSTTSVTLTMPAGMPAADICLAIFDTYNSGSETIAQPSGWHSIVSQCRAGAASSSAAWYETTGSDPSTATWSLSTGTSDYAGLIRCYGPNNTNTAAPLDPAVTPACASNTSVQSISPTLGAGSLSQADDLLILGCAVQHGAVTWSGTFSNCFAAPAIFTSSLYTSTIANVGAWEGVCSGATAPGAQTCTQSASAVAMSGVLIALRPAPPTTTATPSATATPTVTATATATATATNTVTATPTATTTATLTATSTATATATSTATSTATATATATATTTATPAISPTLMRRHLEQTWWWESPWVAR